MKKINFKQQVLPHLIAVIIFLGLTVIFFQPVFFESKTLAQGDILQWKGSAQELMEYRNETGEEGLWTNSIFGGMPAYMVNVKWGNQLIKMMHSVIGFGLPHPVRIIFICMVSFYIMLLCFKVRPYLAIIGAVAFAFSSYNIIGLDAGHNARISAISFMPLVMGAIHLCFTRNIRLGFSLASLSLALQMRVNHLQITYYLFIIVMIYGLIQLIYAYKDGLVRQFLLRLGVLVGAALLAVGTFFGEFYATYEYGKYSNRGKTELSQQTDGEMNENGLGKTYAFQYSNGFWDPMTLFIPNVLGGSQALDMESETATALVRNAGLTPAQVNQQIRIFRAYWGSETPTTYYAGAIMVFLFVVGIFFVERKYVIWLVVISVLGILLSYGRNLPWLNNFLFDYLPGYNKFRSVTFTIIFPIFGICLLGMLGLEKLLQSKLDKASRKKFLIALGTTAGISLLLAIVAGMFGFRSLSDNPQWPAWLIDALHDDRKALFKADAFRTFIFIALFVLIFYLNSIKRISQSVMFAAFILLGVLDTYLVALRFKNLDRFQRNPSEQYFALLPGDQFINQNKQLGDRTLDLTPPSFYDARAAYRHHLINGYHGARIRRFQEVLDTRLVQEFGQLKQQVQQGNYTISGFDILNMLNARFVIANPSSAQGILVNNETNGAAWFVNHVNIVNSPDEEFNALGTFDSKSVAVVDGSKFQMGAVNGSTGGTINLVDYHPGYWKYESSNSQNGFAVFSEIHYPKGFEVTIDGQPAAMARANYILRGLEIPAGNHVIEFRFNPRIYHIGSPIMMVFSILVVAIFLVVVAGQIRSFLNS